MKRKRSHRGNRSRRKLSHQRREGGRGRRLLRFHRQDDTGRIVVEVVNQDEISISSKQGA